VPCAQIWFLIVRHVIGVVLVDEPSIDDPRGIRDDFVYPTTMSDCFAAFCVVHDTLELILFALFVMVHTNEVHIREQKLCLAQLQGVAEMFLSVSPSSNKKNSLGPTQSGKDRTYLGEGGTS
jgi:hypothetical protein